MYHPSTAQADLRAGPRWIKDETHSGDFVQTAIRPDPGLVYRVLLSLLSFT
jgi:hypothetical protein